MYTSTSYCEAGSLPLEEPLALQEHVVGRLNKTPEKPAEKAR